MIIKILGIVFYWHLHLSQDEFKKCWPNICARAWHSVSVMGHKQGLELALPEFTKVLI